MPVSHVAAAAFISTAVAVDRRRAEWLLLALTIGGVISGLLVMTHDYLFAALNRPFPRAQALDCAAMGAIIAAQLAFGYSNRTTLSIRAWIAKRIWPQIGAIWHCIGDLYCGRVARRNSGMFLATVCGIVVLACMLIIRWFGLGGMGNGGARGAGNWRCHCYRRQSARSARKELASCVRRKRLHPRRMP